MSYRSRRKKMIGDFLRMLREGAGYSQQEIADQLYVERSQISRIESNSVACKSNILVRWVKVCGGKTMLTWVSSTSQEVMAILGSDMDHIKFA